jgi:hypothetical protein
MPKPADPETLQRKRWLKALRIACILFEEDGYHTAYLSEIEAFIETKTAITQPMQVNGAAEPPQPAPAESRYHFDHYPYSRFWAVHEGKDLVAVTVYRKGAKEVTDRLEAQKRTLEAQERTIAELKRQIAALSMPHP